MMTHIKQTIQKTNEKSVFRKNLIQLTNRRDDASTTERIKKINYHILNQMSQLISNNITILIKQSMNNYIIINKGR